MYIILKKITFYFILGVFFCVNTNMPHTLCACYTVLDGHISLQKTDAFPQNIFPITPPGKGT